MVYRDPVFYLYSCASPDTMTPDLLVT